MKVCIACNKEKSINEFRIVKNKYTRNTCKDCEKEANKQSYKQTLAYISSLKEECSICGYNRCKAALQFHHKDESTKEFTLAELNTRKWSINTKSIIDKEVEKCIVVCANCHMEIHHMGV